MKRGFSILMVVLFFFLAAFQVPINVSAESKVNPVKPNEGDILPGPFEEWRVEYSYLYRVDRGAWEEEGTLYCYAESCTFERTVTKCSPTAAWGQIKVPLSEIEAAVGFTIGVTDCESKTCSATCSCGKTVVLYSRYKRPIYKVVQRKYLIDQLGGEHPTDEYADAYAREEDVPECLGTCNS